MLPRNDGLFNVRPNRSKLLTLSGSIRLAQDTVQIWDVSMRIKGEAVGEFHANAKAKTEMFQFTGAVTSLR
jgi:hypothetical protein